MSRLLDVCHPGRKKWVQTFEKKIDHSQRMRINAQDDIETSGLYDLIREIFFIPV